MLSDRDRTYLTELATNIRTAQKELDRASANRDDAIRLALESGATVTELARTFNLSRERIYQIRDHRR